MIVSQESPHDALHLLHDSVTYIRSLYPEEHAHDFCLDELTSNGARFFIAFHDGLEVGCAAYIWHGDAVEIKHMYVATEARGLGCGRALLTSIEHHAFLDKAVRVILETSKKQIAAIGLYRACGYVVCDPYTEHHSEDVFMSKVLSRTGSVWNKRRRCACPVCNCPTRRSGALLMPNLTGPDSEPAMI